MAYVDELVTAVVVGRLSAPDAADLLITRKRDDIAELRDRAAALRVRQDEAASLFADGALTASQLKTATEKLSKTLAEVEAKMLDTDKARVFDGVISTADPAAVFDGLTLDRKRAVIDVLLTVTVLPVGKSGRGFNPESVRIEWR